MSKRNLALLIIVLIIIISIVLGYFYFQKPVNTETNTEGTNFISKFNPFSKKTNPPKKEEPADISGYTPTDQKDLPRLKLTKVSSMPIAGFTVFQKERLKEIPITNGTTENQINLETKETATINKNTKKTTPKITAPLTEFIPTLRYVARETGNIYQTFADKIDERKFSSTIIPKIYEAYFGNNGESVAMRYLKKDEMTIETLFSFLPKELLGDTTNGEQEIKGVFLPDNITDLSISKDSSKMFYLFNSNETANGVVFDLFNNKKIQVFDSPFTEWLTQFPNNKIVTLNTKPASGQVGYLYIINTEKKDFIQTMGGITGLTTLTSPNAKFVLYADDNLSLGIFDTNTKQINILGIKTLPEKCVWDAAETYIYCAVPKSILGAEYPDSWYQGETSFNDQIWRINTSDGNAIILDDIVSNAKEEIDGIKLMLDQNENYLFFVNKKDSFLWKLDLE